MQLADAAVESAVRERLGLGSSAAVGGEQLAALRRTLLVVNATSLDGLQFATSLGGLDRERLCEVGWAVRASRTGDAAAVTCGTWCDVR